MAEQSCWVALDCPGVPNKVADKYMTQLRKTPFMKAQYATLTEAAHNV